MVIPWAVRFPNLVKVIPQTEPLSNPKGKRWVCSKEQRKKYSQEHRDRLYAKGLTSRGTKRINKMKGHNAEL